MTCQEQLSVGAYALGTLEPDDRARIAAHLTGCADCREAAEAFAPLPAMLAKVDPRDIGTTVEPSESAYQRLAKAAARQRVQRRRSWLAVAAALVALLVGGTAVGVVNRNSGRDVNSTIAASSGAVHARVTLESDPVGSRLTLQLSGVTSGARCRLVAISDDGRREVAGTWEATYEGTATIRGTTSIPASSVRTLLVETLDGRQLVRLTPRGRRA
jgi:anti-sigma-K factor RskA